MTIDTQHGEKEIKKKSGKHVCTFRQGAIAANVFRRTAQGGFEYLDFSLSRAWKVPTGKEGYSHNFFESNEEALFDVIQQACRFIREEQDERRGVPRTNAMVEIPPAVDNAWVDPA